jgi:hypothetical protein
MDWSVSARYLLEYILDEKEISLGIQLTDWLRALIYISADTLY